MATASAVIYRVPRSDLRHLVVTVAAGQAIAPADEGETEYRSLTQVEVEAFIQGWRDNGYAVEWRIGGYRE